MTALAVVAGQSRNLPDLTAVQKKIEQAEAFAGTFAPNARPAFLNFQKDSAKTQQSLRDADAMLTEYLDASPSDVNALLLQVRLDRVKLDLFPFTVSGSGQVTQTLPAAERDPQVTLDRILAIEPRNAEALFEKARFYGLSGMRPHGGKLVSYPTDFAKAAHFAGQALSLAPNNEKYREAFASYLYRQGKVPEAIDALRTARGGKHPVYRLLLDQSKIPTPERAMLSPELSEKAMMMAPNMNHASARVMAAFGMPAPASEVEAFYCRTWKDFTIHHVEDEDRTEGGELERGFTAMLRWRGDQLEASKKGPNPKSRSMPEDAVILIAFEYTHISEAHAKEYGIASGGVFTEVIWINTRKVTD